ncbi:hypothetical protein C7999DRAFT_12711 [Corynascus novoguineensis]|uniref:Chromo domain-containing protein n=1 Tax=Corynascus novoguineensis TaxID=1126955 RepID=A0AAN7HS33_9PEZI|nr:hypothetical protein C7999DRAFT_12711 [Corynascus novoguineensis]
MADSRHPSRPKTTIEIPLHSIRKYVPGSGPPPPQISLVPPRDSTAYIIDQLILPTDRDMTPTSRRLIYYQVGFTDIPTVKLLIPCNKVLDYVSPRELEDWEYRNLEKKEEERACLLAGRQRAGLKNKKPCRPSNISMEDTGVKVLNAADETLLLAQQVGGPSLSTPQKRKFGQMPDNGEVGEPSSTESDDAAICRKPQGRKSSVDLAFEDDLVLDSECMNQPAPHSGTLFSETPSRASSLAHPLRDLLPPRPATPQPSSATSLELAGPTLGNTPSTSAETHLAWAQAFSRQKQPENSGTTEDSSIASGSSAKKRKERNPNGRGSLQKQQQAKKQKVKQGDELLTDEWEVKELLDDQWFVEQGIKVHRYLVVWEGNWPENQNPTWEPAENIQEKLITQYRKKKEAGLLKSSKGSQKTLHRYMAGARYSSVSEAFEAGMNEQTGQASTCMEREVDQPDEVFLVTNNVGDITANGTKSAPSPGFVFDALLARYNKTAEPMKGPRWE